MAECTHQFYTDKHARDGGTCANCGIWLQGSDCGQEDPMAELECMHAYREQVVELRARIAQLEIENKDAKQQFGECYLQNAHLMDDNEKLGAQNQRLRADAERLQKVELGFESLYAMVNGECPSLLEDSVDADRVQDAVDAARGK